MSHRVIGAALEVHRHLGPGLLESIYERALIHEFVCRGISFEAQKPIEIRYKDVVVGQHRLDLVVEREWIVELKAARLPDGLSMAQILSYLRASGLKRALLLNFSESRLRNGIQRVVL